ncbi:hypothetical protein ACV373_31910, partial [Pseudomonas aeruginosa]
GGVTGAGLGAIESSSWAGWGALIGGGVGAAYCWVHGAGEQVAPPPPQPVEEVAHDNGFFLDDRRRRRDF